MYAKKASDSAATEFDEDIKMLDAFLDGSQTAFSQIYKKYVNDLFAYGIGLGFEQETLKDAIQEVFYKLHLNRKHLQEVNNIKYYLLRMLKNQLLDFQRSKAIWSDLSEEELTFSIKTTILDELISEEEQRKILTRVNFLLNTLTNRQREAIYLRFIQEMEYDEIAKLLNMTAQASRKLVFRAIKRMRSEQIPFILFLITLHLYFD